MSKVSPIADLCDAVSHAKTHNCVRVLGKCLHEAKDGNEMHGILYAINTVMEDCYE